MNTHEPSNGQNPAPGGLEGKLARMTGHTRGLIDEIREWVDLKIQYAVAGVRQEVEAKGKQVAVDVVSAAVALAGVLFLLVAAALALGAWLGMVWGFVIVGGLLLLGAGVMVSLNHRPAGRRSIPVDARRDTPSLTPASRPELEPHEVRPERS